MPSTINTSFAIYKCPQKERLAEVRNDSFHSHNPACSGIFHHTIVPLLMYSIYRNNLKWNVEFDIYFFFYSTVKKNLYSYGLLEIHSGIAKDWNVPKSAVKVRIS